MSQHSPAPVTVVPAAVSDIAPAAAVLAEAFARDTHTVGLLPSGGISRRLNTLFTRVITEALKAGGHVYLARQTQNPNLLGVAVWEAPGQAVTSTPVTSIPDYARVFGTRVLDAARTDRAAHRHRPSVPHWYLRAIGTVPAARGLGVGTSLLGDRLSCADAAGVGAYLESSTPENVSYYQRFGFIERGRIPASGTTEPIGMWRPAP